MPSNPSNTRTEDRGRTLPGGRPGDPERAETHSPPDKPGQFEDESDRKIKTPSGASEAERPRMVPGESPKGPRQSSLAEGEVQK